MKRAAHLSEVQNSLMPEPLETERDLREFYVETSLVRNGFSDSNVAEEIGLELSDSTEVYVHKLFIGHMGSGKSTELYRLMEILRGYGFFTLLARCDLEIDVQDAGYIDILFLILEKLMETAQEEALDLPENVLEEIRDYWYGICEIEESVRQQETISMETEAGVGMKGLVLSLLAKVKGILKASTETKQVIRQRIEPRSSELLRQIIEVSFQLSEKLEERGCAFSIPAVLLDGIDKMPLENARQVFYENGMKFSDLPLHLIVSFPIALSYSAEYGGIQSWFPSPSKLPMIKQRRWTPGIGYEEFPEGPAAIREIVKRRMDLALFEEGVLEELVRKTGGNIRELFRCIKKAALLARMKHMERISPEDGAAALNELKSDINGRYEESDIPLLQMIYNGGKARTGDSEIKKLLQTGAVIEYNATRWCDLHPLVEEWLIETGRMTSSEGQ